MKTKLLAVISCLFGTILQVHSQGYIVPNGVTYQGYHPIFGGYLTHVLQSPDPSDYTGFSFDPMGKTPPTSDYTNTFSFDYYLDEGVRRFLVSSNDPISLQPILSETYTELISPTVFEDGVPFYVALYTGRFSSVEGIYENPVFGWAQYVNNQGVIQMLDSALEYGGAGIYAGTQTIIPEPSALTLTALGTLFIGFRRQRDSAR